MGWGLHHHFPGQPISTPDHLLHEEILPSIPSKSFLVLFDPWGWRGVEKTAKPISRETSDGDQAEEADVQTEVRTKPGVGNGNIFGVYVRAIRLQ